MIKVFCDSCLKEIGSTKRSIDVPHHLIKEERNNFGGYQDIDGNQISGKTYKKDLCIKCFNEFLLQD
jgi:hypothetical protein